MNKAKYLKQGTHSLVNLYFSVHCKKIVFVISKKIPSFYHLIKEPVVLNNLHVIYRNQNQELYMANVNKIREGLYTCRATNVYGEAESTAYLKVLGKKVYSSGIIV